MYRRIFSLSHVPLWHSCSNSITLLSLSLSTSFVCSHTHGLDNTFSSQHTLSLRFLLAFFLKTLPGKTHVHVQVYVCAFFQYIFQGTTQVGTAKCKSKNSSERDLSRPHTRSVLLHNLSLSFLLSWVFPSFHPLSTVPTSFFVFISPFVSPV